jgi:hypothetical protein
MAAMKCWEMEMSISFLTWSIADACDWFVHLPVLGFLGLLLLALLVLEVISTVIEAGAGVPRA